MSIMLAIIISMLVGVVVRLLFALPMPAGDKLTLKRLDVFSGSLKKIQPNNGKKTTLTQLVNPARLLSNQWPFKIVLPKLLNSKKSSKFNQQLISASLDEQISLEDFFGIKIFTATLLPVGLLTLFLGNGTTTVFLLAGSALAGYIIPNSFLSGMVEERQTSIRRQFSDAIDLLVVGMEAGLGFDRALRMYCERFKGPLSEEFNKMLSSIDVGQTRRQALKELAERNQIEDINGFVAAILQAEKLGTPLSEILASQSETARTLRRQWIQEMTAKAPIKIIFPLAGLILPALFAVLLGPIYIKMVSGG